MQIFFNELDDELFAVNDNKTIQIFKLSQNIRIHSVKFEENIRHARLDYKGKKLMVSVGNKIAVVEGGKVVEEIDPPVKDFSYIFPLYGQYFIVGKSGTLYWSKDMKF